MKDKKDAKVRREWGSQSGELLVINEDYIPIPEPEIISSQEDKNDSYGYKSN